MTRKIRVGLLFGGRSAEHEVSLASASSVLRALDRDKYEPVLLGITREGRWLIAPPQDVLPKGEVTLDLPESVEASPDVSRGAITALDGTRGLASESAVDVVFPLIHGPQGEDGTIQGLLELGGIPYVGAGVLGSAVSMDKAMMKNVFRSAGLPTPGHALVRAREWGRDPEAVMDQVEGGLPYPVFVKPCNLGSSVGISKAYDRENLERALEKACRYDRRVIVEEGVDGREIECSVLGNDDPLVSVPGEIVSLHQFYDYEAKYTDGLADLVIPAPLEKVQTRLVQDLARRAFLAVDAAGLARVDLFIRRANSQVLLNEINTIPGFTEHSMYPKLWEATGVSFTDLIDRLVQLALDRHQEKHVHFDTRK